MTNRNPSRTFSFKAEEVIDLSAFEEFQRPSSWRGRSFCLTAASAQELASSLDADPVHDADRKHLTLSFEEISELRPTQVRGNSLRVSFQTADGEELNIFDLVKEENETNTTTNATQQAFHSALLAFLKEKT